MGLAEGDRVVGMEVLQHGQTLFTVTENGYGKRTSIDEYPVHRRGGKGVITIKTTERNGQVVNIILVQDEDDLMLVTDKGKLIRMPVSGTSVISRNTQGVRLIVMDPGERVVSTAGLAEKEDANGMEADEDAAAPDRQPEE
jgi:DNA gyrase subunit A